MTKSEYLQLLEPTVAEYRRRGYDYWRARIGGDPIHLDLTTDAGQQYQVEIEPIWDAKPNSNIRVLFSIDDGSWRAWSPVTRDFLISPDGQFVGQ